MKHGCAIGSVREGDRGKSQQPSSNRHNGQLVRNHGSTYSCNNLLLWELTSIPPVMETTPAVSMAPTSCHSPGHCNNAHHTCLFRCNVFSIALHTGTACSKSQPPPPATMFDHLAMSMSHIMVLLKELRLWLLHLEWIFWCTL